MAGTITAIGVLLLLISLVLLNTSSLPAAAVFFGAGVLFSVIGALLRKKADNRTKEQNTEEAVRIMNDMYNGNFIFVTVEGWKYELKKSPDNTIRVFNRITPADAGYSQRVDLPLPGDYFRTHSIEEFYDFIAAKNTHPDPSFVDRERETEEIRKTLSEAGWLDSEG